MRTVHEANRLARHIRGRRITIRLPRLGGGFRITEGTLVRIIHHPFSGFGLVVRRLGPPGSRGTVGTQTFPVHLLGDPLPEAIRFLRDPPECWPIPSPEIECNSCGQVEFGRFCRGCGTKVRRTHHLGDGFRDEQIRLRHLGADIHSCGAALPNDASYCPKCSRAVGGREACEGDPQRRPV